MIRGSLFSRYFLEAGICQTDAYRNTSPERLHPFAEAFMVRWAKLGAMPRPSEAETESELIFPTLSQLGWHYLPQQEPGRGRRDVADALLFTTEADKDAARRLQGADRFRRGAVVVENEARNTPLDRASGSGEAPSSQLLRYLRRAEQQSDGAVRWGLLCSGHLWRLYWSGAPSRAEGFVEFDLPGQLGDLPPPVPSDAGPDHWLRVFVLLFQSQSLARLDAAGRTFLDDALAENRRYQARVTAELSDEVFNQAFPNLVAAIGRHDPRARAADEQWRADAREAALRLLFRLLFVLSAEDRDLLPVQHRGYADYSLQRMRDEAARLVDDDAKMPARAATWWPRLRALFDAIAAGDAAMGVPPYNGGLFDDAPGSLLTRLSLPDVVLAPLLDAIAREGPPLARRPINYRDLSVQHLGSIYEGLLERDVVAADDGNLVLRPNAFARKTSGSYYTPEELVGLILRRAVGPLLRERRDAFAARAAALANDTRRKGDRLAQLAPLDPAEAFLRLRICDPAMGSGHFLVSLVDYLADETLNAIVEAPALVTWEDYRSPLMRRIEEMRARIQAQAAAHGWTVRADQLDDKHIVRRIVLKRCIYGVDLNPMAVELAKLALWLHSFTVGAPLSFLDHHLRCGDSLYGEFVGPVERDLRARYGLSLSGEVVAARNAASGMALVEQQADADIAEVQASAAGFAGVEADTAPLRALLDLYHAARWRPDRTPAAMAARDMLFGGNYGGPVAVAGGAPLKAPRADATAITVRGRAAISATQAYDSARDFVAQARALAADRRFLHWEVAFPGVWEDWERLSPSGGFDAVIGNPPWDRMKMQEVEWFAARVPAIATATRAADRKRAIQALRAGGDQIAAAYDYAAAIAEAATRVARELGARSPLPRQRAQAAPPEADAAAYPLLSGGDVNLYALMVERAARLVRADGIVGLLVPSGIAADLGAAAFFRAISTSGRLAALLDFENRRTTLRLDPFFPDVDSRFKFAAFVFGGVERRFAEAACAFFKQSAAAAEREAFPLAPADFLAVNPNTGTAPVFRSERDAAITKSIYARLPVLVDRRERPARHVWPVRYLRMFDMTNDSGKFRTAAELRRLGAYEVEGGRWEKGSVRWVPLYEGKMIQAYDHRAASVIVNPANVHRPGQPQNTSEMLHEDPAWSAKPQFWVLASDDALQAGLPACLGFKDITSATNARTVIAAALPPVACNNKLPLLLPASGLLGAPDITWGRWLPLLLANLNAFALDSVARQKVHATSLNLYILEQLPVMPLDAFDTRFGTKSAEQIVRDDVLALTYTSHDLAAFAADQGYTGPPFRWDAEDRLRRRARLDALFFLLYGLDRDDAAYVMDSFPIVREQEVAAYGRFRSRALVLNWMAALAAGNPDAKVAG